MTVFVLSLVYALIFAGSISALVHRRRLAIEALPELLRLTAMCRDCGGRETGEGVDVAEALAAAEAEHAVACRGELAPAAPAVPPMPPTAIPSAATNTFFRIARKTGRAIPPARPGLGLTAACRCESCACRRAGFGYGPCERSPRPLPAAGPATEVPTHDRSAEAARWANEVFAVQLQTRLDFSRAAIAMRRISSVGMSVEEAAVRLQHMVVGANVLTPAEARAVAHNILRPGAPT
jgi:hypothetical protein